MIQAIKNFFSPQKATDRTRGRRVSSFSRRSFPMGESGISAAVADWPTTYTSTVSSIIDQGPAIMARARRLVAADPYAVRYLKLLENNVLGCNGFCFQSKVAKRNGRLDQKPNTLIENLWWDWGKADTASRNGTSSFQELCALVLKACAVDGGALVIHHEGRLNQYGYSVEVRSHEDLMWDHYGSTGPKNIAGGIEYDDRGKAIAYWIRDWEMPTRSSGRKVGRYTRYPAGQVTYIFRREFIGQTHGISWFYPVGLRMKLQNKFDQAAVTHAAIGACQMGFIKKTSTYDPDETDESDVADIEQEEEGEINIEVKAGSFPELPEGYDLVPWKPEFPNSNYGPFSDANLGGIAVGLGVARTSLTGDLSKVNYSSIRAGVLEEREEWKRLQSWMIDAFVMQVFKRWFDMQFVTGQFPFSAEKYDYFYQPSFVGRRWPWVDPAKDAQAHETMLRLKLTSRKRILAEQGVDIEELDEEINSDEMSIEEPQPAQPQASPQPEQAEPDAEDEAENAQQQQDRRFDLNGYGH